MQTILNQKPHLNARHDRQRSAPRACSAKRSRMQCRDHFPRELERTNIDDHRKSMTRCIPSL